eukprot:COSAG06_NODE_30785_length_532_cov_1.099307_2_plen_87_part_01
MSGSSTADGATPLSIGPLLLVLVLLPLLLVVLLLLLLLVVLLLVVLLLLLVRACSTAFTAAFAPALSLSLCSAFRTIVSSSRLALVF